MNALRNPLITLAVAVSGRRVGEGSVPEAVTSTLTKTIKIETNLSIEATGLHTTGPFTNTGPWPPEADKETTYTIQLEAGSTVNSVANAIARTTLPSYVRFTGLTSPADGIKYNETTREVAWTVGDLAAGQTKTAAFQVSILPSVSQIGDSPDLTSMFRITGYDRFIGKETSGEAEEVTTRIPEDPAFTIKSGNVQ